MWEKVSGKTPLAAVVKAAHDEARRRGDRRLGTEHLLLGLLRHDESARALAVDLPAAREALAGLDRAALAAVGIDVRDFRPDAVIPARRRPPWSSAARAALGTAVGLTTAKTRREAPKHLLATLLAYERPDPAADLLAELGVERAAVRARLR